MEVGKEAIIRRKNSSGIKAGVVILGETTVGNCGSWKKFKDYALHGVAGKWMRREK